MVFIGCGHRGGGGSDNTSVNNPPTNNPPTTQPSAFPQTFSELKSKFPAFPYVDSNMFDKVYEQGFKSYAVTDEVYNDFYSQFIVDNNYTEITFGQNNWLAYTDELEYISFKPEYPNHITVGLRNRDDTYFDVTDEKFDSEFGLIDGNLTHIDYYMFMLGGDNESSAILDDYAQTLVSDGFTCNLTLFQKQCDKISDDGSVVYRWIKKDKRTGHLMAFPNVPVSPPILKQTFAELRAEFPAFPQFEASRFTFDYQQGYKMSAVTPEVYDYFYSDFVVDKTYAINPSYRPLELIMRSDDIQYLSHHAGSHENALYVGIRNVDDTNYAANDEAFDAEFGFMGGNITQINYNDHIMIGNDAYASQVLNDYAQILEGNGFTCVVIDENRTSCQKISDDNKSIYKWYKADVHTSYFTQVLNIPEVTPSSAFPQTFAELSAKFPSLSVNSNMFSKVYRQGFKAYDVTTEVHDNFFNNFIVNNGYAATTFEQNHWLARTDGLEYISFEDASPSWVTVGLRNYADTSLYVTDEKFDAEFGFIRGNITHIDYYTFMLGNDTEASNILDGHAQHLANNGFVCDLNIAQKQCDKISDDGTVVYRWLKEAVNISRMMAFKNVPAVTPPLILLQTFAELRAEFPAFPQFDESRFSSVYQQGYKYQEVTPEVYSNFYQNFIPSKPYAVNPQYRPNQLVMRVDGLAYMVYQENINVNAIRAGIRNLEDTLYSVNDEAFDAEFGFFQGNIKQVEYCDPIMFGDDAYASQILNDYAQILADNGFTCNVIDPARTICEKASDDDKSVYQWYKADSHTSYFTETERI